MKYLIALAASLLIAGSASAQVAGTVGPAQDWIKVNSDAKYEDFTTPLAGIAYDIVFANEGSGMTLGGRWTDGEEILQEYSLGYWQLVAGDTVEWFSDAIFETWGPEITGDREFLGGVRAGLRFPLADSMPVEFSGRYSAGADGQAHIGVFFGLRK